MGNSNTLSNRGPIGTKLVIGISRNIAVDSRKGVLCVKFIIDALLRTNRKCHRKI